MKHVRLVILSLLLMPSINAVAATLTGANEIEARTVLSIYFDAMVQGDTLTMRSLLTGNLLKKRSRLLDNPTYPSYLAKTYGNASFSIDRLESTGSSTVAANVSIFLDKINVSYRRFLLRKEISSPGINPSYLIYDETNLNTR